MLILTLEDIFGTGHVDRPAELVALSFVVDFFDGDTMFLTPAMIQYQT